MPEPSTTETDGEILTRRVLVVDDDQTIRDVLTEALGIEGYDARGAGNGSEALQVMVRWRPHLVLLDLMMPVMDGWAFLAAQQDQVDLREIPVIVLSAVRNLADHEADLQVAGLHPKPFELENLLQDIERVLR
jgi:CheY-like chemotaxis protein